MAITISIWPGSGSAVSGTTPFGFYDAESDFKNDAPRFAKWAAYRFGYPIQDVELQDVQFYACFEEAVTEYSYQVNLFNAQQNILRLQGVSTTENFTQKSITSNFGGIIKIAEQYGQEAMVGGSIPLRRAYFVTTSSLQEYDLYEAVSSSLISQSIAVPDRMGIEIKRVFHNQPPAIARYFDPFAGTGMGTYSMMQEFGWTNYSVATSFMMLPIYADILRLQAIEFNDLVRRSGYGFEVINKNIRIFPVPQSSFAVWFDYILTSERSGETAASGSNISSSLSGSSDMSNVPYQNMQYNKINSIGRQWIRDYGLAITKMTLGRVRGKYATIPIPNNEIAMDGNDLLTQGQVERDLLIENLRTMLEKFTRVSQLQKEADEKEALQKTLSGIPLPIYVGILALFFIPIMSVP
jgi:hypothetical protein